MADQKCDVCGVRDEGVEAHEASGIFLCRDRSACVARHAPTPLEKAARLCEQRAYEALATDDLTIDELLDAKGRARLLYDLAREIRSL